MTSPLIYTTFVLTTPPKVFALTRENAVLYHEVPNTVFTQTEANAVVVRRARRMSRTEG